MKDAYYLDPSVADGYDADILPLRDIVRDDISFYVGLAREAPARGHSVLELACGTGRVTLPIAAAAVPVLGLDRSPAMLDVARRKAAGAANPRWIEADMADFRLDERFGLVIIPFRSFLLLATVAEQKACLRCVHDRLVEGGRLALNLFNPDLVMMASWLGTERPRLEQTDEQRLAGAQRRQSWVSRRYLTAGQEIDEQRIDEELGDDDAIVSRVSRNLRLRYVFRYEVEHLLALCGFEVEALHGWFDGRPFADDSAEMVWQAWRASVQIDSPPASR